MRVKFDRIVPFDFEGLEIWELTPEETAFSLNCRNRRPIWGGAPDRALEPER